MVVKDPTTDEGIQIDVPLDALHTVAPLLQAEAQARGATWIPIAAAGAPQSASSKDPKAPAGVTLAAAASGIKLKSTAKFAALAL